MNKWTIAGVVVCAIGTIGTILTVPETRYFLRLDQRPIQSKPLPTSSTVNRRSSNPATKERNDSTERHRHPVATIQTSHGSMSPNISNAKKDVHIKYEAETKETEEHTADTSTAASSARRADTLVTQTSHGPQSPNIVGVGGNLVIQYGSPASSENKSPETTR